MTREEAIARIKEHMIIHKNKEPRAIYITEALEMAIKALSQEPCTDNVSRQAAIEAVSEGCQEWRGIYGRCEELINALPSVNPQKSETVTEFADRCRECGKQKSGHWILADEQNKEDVENDNYRFICSECQCSDIQAKGAKVPYCWKCGAKMESEVQTDAT